MVTFCNCYTCQKIKQQIKNRNRKLVQIENMEPKNHTTFDGFPFGSLEAIHSHQNWATSKEIPDEEK